MTSAFLTLTSFTNGFFISFFIKSIFIRDGSKRDTAGNVNGDESKYIF